MLPREDKIATALLALGLTVAAVVSVLAMLVLEACFAFGWFTVMSDLPGFSLWVGGITFASGVFILIGQFALRERQYGLVAVRNLTQGAVTAVSQLSLAVASTSPIGLVTGYFIGRVAGIAPLLKSLRTRLRPFDRSDIMHGLRRYRTFPLLFAPAALLNAGALAAPIIITGLWFEVSDAGQFGMAERVLAVPLVIVATGFGQVVEARLALHVRENISGSVRYFIRVSLLLTVFSVFIGTLVWFGAPGLVPLILGEEWHATATIMQLLIPMLVTRLIASPMSKAIVVVGWAQINLVLDIARALLIATILLMCWWFNAPLDTLILGTSLAFAIIYAATWFVGLRSVRSLDARTDLNDI